jgi:peptide/nickel transport system substrate-binding protein
VVGTGPYRVRSWQGGTVELERFDGYRGPRPAVARIVFRYEPDAARALRRARAGEIDVIPALIREHRGEQARAPGSSAAHAPLRLRPPALRYMALNARRPPFDDVRVRCALGRLIDRPALVAAGKHITRPVGGPIWPGGPGDGPAMEAPPFDRAGAGALLDQAGWRDDDGDGLRARDGKRMLLTVLVSDRPDDERDRVLDALRAAGFVVDARVGSTAVLDNRLRDGRFDVAFVEWRGLPGEDLAPALGTSGAQNFGGFSDARIDEALAALRAAWQPGARWAAMGHLGALVAEACPVVPLVAPDPHGLVARRVRGLAPLGGWFSIRALSLAPAGEPR